jgi:RNase P/RNase MRP subunit POP5
MRLLPSLRQTKRYVVFEIQSDTLFSSVDIKETVETALKEFFGQLGMSKASPMFLKEKTSNNKFILKVNHRWVDEAKSAIILIKSIKKKPVLLKSIITSGTLKKASSYL